MYKVRKHSGHSVCLHKTHHTQPSAFQQVCREEKTGGRKENRKKSQGGEDVRKLKSKYGKKSDGGKKKEYEDKIED